MSVFEKAATTMIWMKRQSATTIQMVTQKISNLISNSPIIRYAGIGLLGWIVLNIIFISILQSKRHSFENAFHDRGVFFAHDLADKIGSSILVMDYLALNVAVRDLMADPNIRYIAILDHQNVVLTHSDSGKINRQFNPAVDEKLLNTVNGIQISSGMVDEHVPVVTYRTGVTYSGVKIGTVLIGQDAQKLESMAITHHLYKTIFLFGSAILLVIMVVLTMIVQKKRKQKREKMMADMTRIGPYLLTRKIAEGGMAELYLADYLREDGFRKTVAIKKVLPHLADNRDFIDMFIREARLAALLQHPNITQIADFGKMQNVYFIGMEYVNGKNLAQIMEVMNAGLPMDMAIFLIMQISSGLHYSHTLKDDKTGKPLNIIHRDISPPNILISMNGEVKISDFGISKATSEPSLTMAGVIKGKLAYLSPEQAMGEEANHQTDIYALGLVFYEILLGKRVHQFDNEIDAIRSIPKITIAPIITKRPDIPPELNAIIMKCLEKSLAKRYQSAEAIKDDLHQLKNELGIVYDASDLSQFMQTHFGSPESEITP
ncbi:Pkn: serine/threonine kinase [Desulfosarcina variabilis str. Montpellier]|uniref:serine/threonine protein kinase n=1 Tax=Desulfosarcina variabilis TaxID=2300 RepID=UPI003AFA01E3